ncbi:hypothetical protein Tco_0567266 [Tanacetum coccineum]
MRVSSRNSVGGIRWRGVGKQVRVLALKLVFALPSEFRICPRIPSYLDNRDAAFLQSFDLSVHDLYRLLNEMKLIVDLDLFQQNDE